MQTMTDRRALTGSDLKFIAVFTMFLDHCGACLLEGGLLRLDSVQADMVLWRLLFVIDRILRLTGRISFPIFCFLLVEGFLHTKNRTNYAVRLFVFALLSEIPFDLAICHTLFDFRVQNVFFTLLIGLLVMIFCDRLHKRPLAQIAVLAGGALFAYILRTDYSYKGVLLIEILYLFRYDRVKQTLAGALAFCWEITAPLAFIPVWYYNGRRGLRTRWFFYWFYPIHLLLLWGIKFLIMQ